MKIRDLELDGVKLEMIQVWINTCLCIDKRTTYMEKPGAEWCYTCNTYCNTTIEKFIWNKGPVAHGILYL